MKESREGSPKKRPNFILNKSGIPLSYEAWTKLWKFYDYQHEQLKQGIYTITHRL